MVRLKAVPEDGKANKALIKYISKLTSTPQCDIELFTGKSSRNKVLLVKITTPDTILDVIAQLMGCTIEQFEIKTDNLTPKPA